MKTERERLLALLEKNAFLDHIFDCIHDGIIMTDPDGLIAYLNASAQKIIGIPKEKLMGTVAADMPVAMYSHQKEILKKRERPFGLTERTQEDQGPQNVFLQRPDGKTVPLLFNVGIADDGQMVAILTDNSEMMQKQQQMEEYFSLVAHDLRTPLTVILGYAEMMAKQMSSQVSAEDVFRKIWDVGGQMQTMLEGFADRMRIESDNYDLDKSDINLIALVQDIAAQHTLDDNSPHIHVDIEEKLLIHADLNLLQRVLHNLVSNAAKYSPQNSIVTIHGWSNDRGVLLTVSDQGQGVDTDDLPYIFDPFFITSVGKQKGGIGLGLHITEKIVQLHEGNIFVSSQKGEGTTFGIFLPHPA